MRIGARVLRMCLVGATLLLAAAPARADTAWDDVLQDGLAAARAAQQTLRKRPSRRSWSAACSSIAIATPWRARRLAASPGP